MGEPLTAGDERSRAGCGRSAAPSGSLVRVGIPWTGLSRASRQPGQWGGTSDDESTPLPFAGAAGAQRVSGCTADRSSLFRAGAAIDYACFPLTGRTALAVSVAGGAMHIVSSGPKGFAASSLPSAAPSVPRMHSCMRLARFYACQRRRFATWLPAWRIADRIRRRSRGRVCCRGFSLMLILVAADDVGQS